MLAEVAAAQGDGPVARSALDEVTLNLDDTVGARSSSTQAALRLRVSLP